MSVAVRMVSTTSEALNYAQHVTIHVLLAIQLVLTALLVILQPLENMTQLTENVTAS